MSSKHLLGAKGSVATPRLPGHGKTSVESAHFIRALGAFSMPIYGRSTHIRSGEAGSGDGLHAVFDHTYFPLFLLGDGFAVLETPAKANFCRKDISYSR